MTAEPEPQRPTRVDLPSFRSTGWRWRQLAALLGLTGFAISQPLLAVAGDDTTLFTFAGVSGWAMVGFALIVALVPPLVLWIIVLVLGLVDRRVGDVAFIGFCGALAGAAVIQWAKTIAGVEQAWLLAAGALVAAVGFAAVMVRVPTIGLWVRFTAILPVVAVVLFLVASPASDLLQSRQSAPDQADGAPAGGPGEAPPSVVFIMLDEFPLKTVLADDGTIDEVRFPNLAALADGATWYRDYTVQANGTLQSIPSILSGRVPKGGSPLWTDHPDNIFSLLAPTHDLAAIESVTQLCGFTNCEAEGAQRDQGGMRAVLSRVVDVWGQRVSLDPIPEADLDQFAAAAEPLDPEAATAGFFGGNDGEEAGEGRDGADPGVVDDLQGALERLESPSLTYLHLLLPHQPWVRYPDGRTFDSWTRLELNMGGVEVDEWVAAQLNQAHIYQARYADQLLGEVIEALKAQGIYDDALVVVTADHGIGFGEAHHDQMRFASPETMNSIAYVPLIVKSPGQTEGRVDQSNLMGVDLIPTIAAELDIDIPWETDGFPAGSPEIAARGTTKVFFDFGTEWSRDVQEVIEFDVDETRPDSSNRPVGSISGDEHSLSGLARSIEAHQWLGVEVEVLDLGSARVHASVPRLRQLQLDSATTPGRLAGTTDPSVAGSTVLLVVDGVVQSVAPVAEDGSFAFLVPKEVEPHAGAELGLLEASDGSVTEVELSSP